MADSLNIDGVEYRFNEDGTIDEIVGRGSFHLEQMADQAWWIGITPDQAPHTMQHFDLWTPRTRIRLGVHTETAGLVDFGEFPSGIVRV